jgi:hypothetical protein
MENNKKTEQFKKEEDSFLHKLLEDVNSNKPYSEKKYLQEYNKMHKKNEHKKNCINKNCNSPNFFSNYSNSNNVYISGLGTSDYNCYYCPSPFN